MFVEKYIKEPFNYAMSDWKKIFVGGVFGLIYMLPTQLLNAILQTNNYIQYMESSTGSDISLLISLLGMFGLIVILSIIFGSFQYGYYMKLAKYTVEYGEDAKLPEWEDWKNLFKKGILFYIGSLLLALIVFLPFIIIASIIGYVIFLVGGIPILIIYFFTALGIYLLISLIYMFYFYLASVNFANVGFKGFFEFKKIINLFSLKYILLVIILLIIMMVLSFIASLPSLIINIGVVLSNNMALSLVSAVIDAVLMSFVGFFTSVVIYRSISKYYKEKMHEKGYL